MFALDYDGTIADTNTVKSRWLRKHLGIQVAPCDCDRSTCVPIVGEETYELMSSQVYEQELSLQAGIVPGAKQAIRLLGKCGPIHVVSARSERQLEYASEWLKRKGLLPYITSLVSTRCADKISRATSLACRILIDDDERHLRDSGDCGMSVVLLKIGAGDYASRFPHVSVFSNWRDAASYAMRVASG